MTETAQDALEAEAITPYSMHVCIMGIYTSIMLY
jgi:hypothetical protein